MGIFIVKYTGRDNSTEASQEMNIERYGVPNDAGDGMHNEIWIPVKRKTE